MKKKKANAVAFYIFTTMLIAGLISEPADAGWFGDNFIDPSDGKLDMGKYLAENNGFLPMPIILTEPAIGYGLGVAALFIHDPLAGKTKPGKAFDPNPDTDGKLKPPSVSTVFGAYTNNGTWFGGGAHLGIWNDDTIRYTGALAKANINMTYYGFDGGNGQLGDSPIKFNTEAIYLLQELLFRVGGSNFFAGLEFNYIDTDNTFDSQSIFPDLGIPDAEFSSTSAGLGLVLQYQGLDNSITPGSGLKAEFKAANYGKTWGGDSDYNKYRLFANYWLPVQSNWLLGLRVDGSAVTNNPPFYEYPFINMRGIPVMRYQGKETLVGETELRYDITPRWSVLGFAGAGKAYSDKGTGDSDAIISKGFGFRYLAARRLGMRMGIDIAWGPEDTAIYLQFGSAWWA